MGVDGELALARSRWGRLATRCGGTGAIIPVLTALLANCELVPGLLSSFSLPWRKFSKPYELPLLVISSDATLANGWLGGRPRPTVNSLSVIGNTIAGTGLRRIDLVLADLVEWLLQRLLLGVESCSKRIAAFGKEGGRRRACEC